MQEDDDKEPEEDAAEGVEVADMNADIGKQRDCADLEADLS